MSLSENLFDTTYDHSDTPCSIRCNNLTVDGTYSGTPSVPDHGFSMIYQLVYNTNISDAIDPVIFPFIAPRGYNTNNMYNTATGIATFPSTGKWLLTQSTTISNSPSSLLTELTTRFTINGSIPFEGVSFDVDTIPSEENVKGTSYLFSAFAGDTISMSLSYSATGTLGGFGSLLVTWGLQRLA